MLAYAIMPASMVAHLDFGVIHQTSPETLRRSKDGTKVVVSFESYVPPDCCMGHPMYTKEKVKELMKTPEWS